MAKKLTDVLKSEEQIKLFFDKLLDNGWNVDKLCKEHNINRKYFYDIVKLPPYKAYMETVTEVARLIAFAQFMEGIMVADLNTRIKFINKLPDGFLQQMFGVNVTAETFNNSNQIML